MATVLWAVLGVNEGAATAACAFTPTNDVPLDAESGEPLLFPGKLNVFNVYWDGDWDDNPANFRRSDIEHAMQKVIDTNYFDRLCQYGVEGVQWEGGTTAAGICGSHPGSVTTTPSVFSFMSCEEYTPFTGVPTSLGAPNPITCAACGAVPIDCFNVLEPLCAATPNPTGNRIYVVFLPKGTTINDFGRQSCVDYDAFHFQIPSRALFNFLPPFTIPGSQGRPLNLAIIPTDCFASVSDMMAAVTHELVEAATDPLPLAHWIDESTGTRGNRFDFNHIETLLTEGEVSDICHGSSVLFTAADGTQARVADYWSNHDNQCLSLDVVPPVTTATTTPSPASGWSAGDVLVTLTATDPAPGEGVREIVFSATGADPHAATTVAGASATLPLAAEGITVVTFHAVDNAGNIETAKTITVRIDRTAPTIAGAAAPPPNGAGWNNTPVTVTFTCSDTLSGIASCTAPITLSGDGANQNASGSAVDRAGNHAATTVSGVYIDRTPPLVTYAGNAGTYTVDQTVAITCAASDALSGVASTTCADLNQPAWVVDLGAHTLSATATDVAGNVGSGSTTFTVIVTEASLCNLATTFASSRPGVASGLCAKLDAAAHAATPTARAGQLGAFANQVQAQAGKALTDAQAAVLLHLVAAL